ncbi:hypothetical protein PCC7424_2268 [Gloeothece citriformis PCC 7424]|uniref:Uncharacterized protein n=1 Tax=Gloeothece citriformis (strain PCC 7424) TaxID=65393 RepID=B7KHJ5_GLOC7|nr:hypothetical protein [Gloeothece citriformis]ACK70690.1 hypothetical protein PCC7424_2268 [Gloeothece citriformis PCC 7424]
MTDAYHLYQSNKVLDRLVLADSGWKVVYCINENYYIEDIIAYAVIKNGDYFEMIPLTLSDIHSCQTLQEYALKDGYIGLINPENELILKDYLDEEAKDINIQEIKKALKKNRIKLE